MKRILIVMACLLMAGNLSALDPATPGNARKLIENPTKENLEQIMLGLAEARTTGQHRHWLKALTNIDQPKAAKNALPGVITKAFDTVMSGVAGAPAASCAPAPENKNGIWEWSENAGKWVKAKFKGSHKRVVEKQLEDIKKEAAKLRDENDKLAVDLAAFQHINPKEVEQLKEALINKEKKHDELSKQQLAQIQELEGKIQLKDHEIAKNAAEKASGSSDPNASDKQKLTQIGNIIDNVKGIKDNLGAIKAGWGRSSSIGSYNAYLASLAKKGYGTKIGVTSEAPYVDVAALNKIAAIAGKISLLPQAMKDSEVNEIKTFVAKIDEIGKELEKTDFSDDVLKE